MVYKNQSRRQALKGLGVLGGIGLAGCTGGTSEEMTTWRIDLAGSGTMAFSMMQGIQNLVNENSDTLEIDARTGQGSGQSMAKMARGDTDLAFGTNIQGVELENQEGQYEDLEADFHQLHHFYSIQFGLTTYPDDTGIRSIEDLPGNSATFGTTAGSGHRLTPQWLDLFINIDEVDINPMPFEEEPGALGDGRVDAAQDLVINQIHPSYIDQIHSQGDSWVLEWPDNAEEVVNDHPKLEGSVYTPEELTGEETYEAFGDRDEEFYGEAIFHIYSNDEVSDENVEEYLNILTENIDELPEYHAGFVPYSNPGYFDVWIDGLSVHPQAEAMLGG